jgi:hypothetical protein
MSSYLNFEIMYIFGHRLKYCDMSSEIIQNVTRDNYDDFKHVNFIFSQKFHFTILRII